jgi:hypothetical protein
MITKVLVLNDSTCVSFNTSTFVALIDNKTCMFVLPKFTVFKD